MRRSIPFAIVAALLAVPALGQHAAAGGHAVSGHSGFSGRSAPAPRSGSSAPSLSRSAGVARPGSRPIATRPEYATRSQTSSSPLRRGGPGHGSGNPVGHIGDRRDGHNRRVYIPVFAGGYPYGYGALLAPGYATSLDYGDDSGDMSANQDTGPVYYDNGGNNGAPQDQQPQEPPRWPSIGPYAPSSVPSAGAAEPSAEQAVTLVFKDGRPPQQVHNYVLTQSAIFVGDARGKSIPLDQLDMDATVEANRNAGVDFQLPHALN